MKTTPTASTQIMLETRRKIRGEYHPVKLRITYQRDRKYYTVKGPDGKTLFFESVEAFNNAMTGEKPSKEIKELRLHIAGVEEKAMKIIKNISDFTFETFEAEYFSKVDKGDVISRLRASAKRLREEGKISTAVGYECTANSLNAFTGKSKLNFKDVNVKFLKKYESWMTSERKEEDKVIKPNSLTTVGIYLRNVRAIFNESKLPGITYPFGRAKHGLYQIPKGRNVKKALTIAQVQEIAAYKCAGTFETRSRDLWLFSYLANGINVKDIARLRYSDIISDGDGAKIRLIRAKTAGSVEERQPIDIIITRPIGRIIDRWGTKSDGFIFPILTPAMTAEDEYRAIQQAVQTINKNMKRICEDLKMKPVTTYTARHSFATVLKRSGASVEFISESLGHTSKDTTQKYLKSFEDDEKKKWASILLPEPE